MSCALSGISSFSASSTARTDAMAWTVVQTPQKRCVKIQASRGIAAQQDGLDAAPHAAEDQALVDLAALDLDVDAQVPFDAGDRDRW